MRRVRRSEAISDAMTREATTCEKVYGVRIEPSALPYLVPYGAAYWP